jgi:hypothetical protein
LIDDDQLAGFDAPPQELVEEAEMGPQRVPRKHDRPGNAFTGTVGQDIGIAQNHFIANGVDTGRTVNANNTTFTFPISGIFGFQNTWTSGDTIDMTKKNGVVGHGNSIIATFDFSTDLVTTTIGVQSITVSVVPFIISPEPNTILIEGGFVTNRLGATVANFSGVTKFTMQNSAAGSEVIFGTDLTPLEIPTVPTLNVMNVPGANPAILGPAYQQSGLAVRIDATSIASVTVNASNVGSAPTVSAGADDFVPGSAESFFVSVGNPTGTASPVTWNINSSGSHNFLFLNANGDTSATTLAFTGTAPVVLFGSDFDFQNVTKISSTAKITVTGALQEDGAFFSEGGILADNTVITSISGGAGSFFDLSSLDATQALAMTTINGGGGGTAVFSNEALTGLSSALALSGISVVGDGGDFGFGPGIAGTINFAFLPGANELKFFHGLDFSSTGLVVNNTPNTFTIDFQDENFHGNDVTINAANPTTTGNSLTIGLGTAHDTVHGLDENFTVSGYDSYTILVRAGTGQLFNGDPTFFAIDSFTGTPAPTSTVNLTLSGVGSLVWGDVFNVSDASSFTEHQIGTPSIELFGGNITDNLKGFLDIGIFDAQSLNASASGGLYQHDPGTFLGANFTVTAAANPGSSIDQVLQGSLGPLDFGNTNGRGAFDDGFTATNTFLTGGHDGGDVILTTGGTTTVNLNNPQGADAVLFDMFNDNSDLFFTPIDGESVPIVEDSVAVTEFNGDFNTEGVHTTTINKFVVVGSNPGVNDDVVSFSPDSWGSFGGNNFGGTYIGLVQGDGTQVEFVSEETFATMFLASGSNQTLNADTNVVVYELNSFAGGLKALENALSTSGGAIKFDFTAGSGDTFDFLFAYNNGNGGVNISDIQFEGNGADNSTQFLSFTGAHNLVTLTNITGGVGSLFNEYLAHHSNIFFNT